MQITNTPFEGTEYGSLAIEDVDGDNKPEILISGRLKGIGDHGSTVQIYKNYGKGIFSKVTGRDFGLSSEGAFAIADIDGENKPDIYTAGLKARFYKNTSVSLTGACIAPTGCNTYTSPSGKYTWTQGGVYMDTIKMTTHDSIITINLLIDSLEARFTVETDPDGNFGHLIRNKCKGKGMSFLWDFGDGNTATGVSPEHTYADKGTYNLCVTVTSAAGCTEQYCENISIVGKKAGPFSIKVTDETEGTLATGLEDLENGTGSLSFSLYPNPTKHTLNVVNNSNLDKFDVTVRDMLGREVMTVTNQESKAIIDMSGYVHGVYIIQVRSDNKTETYKVLKD